jgi:hypothetical protein
MRRLPGALLALALVLGVGTPPADAATLHRYADGVWAMAGGGHRIALTDLAYTPDLPTRVIDERSSAALRTITRPGVYCAPTAIGAGFVAYGCMSGPTLVAIADGSVHTPAFSEYTNANSTRVEAVGARRLLLHVSAYHEDSDYLVDVQTGADRLVRDSSMEDPYALRIPVDRVIDLDARSGLRKLCRPIRRHDYRQPELFFDFRGGNATWASRSGEWLQRCGHEPVRLSRTPGGGWVATRRMVAWQQPGRVVAVDRRTLERRSWPLSADADGVGLALSRDRIWVNTASGVLTGRLPGR